MATPDMTSAVMPFNDIAPVGDMLTEYDRAYVKLYMRLLDAAEWTEAVNILFDIAEIIEGGHPPMRILSKALYAG